MELIKKLESELVEKLSAHWVIVEDACNYFNKLMILFMEKLDEKPLLPDLSGLSESTLRVKKIVGGIICLSDEQIIEFAAPGGAMNKDLNIHRLLCILMEKAFIDSIVGSFGFFESYTELESALRKYKRARVLEAKKLQKLDEIRKHRKHENSQNYQNN